jgi:hypothetical protein
VLEDASDDLGLAHYWRWYGYTHWANLRAERAREAWERALAHAAAAGANRLRVESESYILSALALGPVPVDEALPQAERTLEQAVPGSLVEGSALRAVGKLRACRGQLDDGRRMHQQGRAIFREAGMYVTAAGWAMSESEIEWRAGNLDAQERVLRESVEVLDALHDQFFFSTVALRLADCLLLTRAPDDQDVAEICATARERTLPGDLVNFVYLDGIEARRLAHSGSAEVARELARTSTETADTTDNFDVRSHAWYACAETLVLIGDFDEAERAARESIAIRNAKGDVAGAAALERRYRELGVEVAR